MIFYFDRDFPSNHIPSDSRDGNGFWVPFKVYGVHGEFSCLNDESCSWKSKELQVDVLVSQFSRINFSLIFIVLRFATTLELREAR